MAKHSTLAVLLWMSSIFIGTGVSIGYSLDAGEIQAAPGCWPVQLDLADSGPHSRLLVLLHPECPCSTATLDELQRLLDRYPQQFQTDVVFSTPHTDRCDVTQSRLWQQAEGMAGVRLCADDGETARAFGANTSGAVLLYSPEGTLIFQGGITASRGQRGDNRGRKLVERFLDGRDSDPHRNPVFGCCLANAEAGE